MTMLWSIYVTRNGSPYFEQNFGQLMPILLLSLPAFAVFGAQTGNVTTCTVAQSSLVNLSHRNQTTEESKRYEQ